MVLVAVESGHAQVRLAPELVIAEDVDFGLGGHVFIPIGTSNFEVGGYFDYYFVSGAAGYSELGGTGYYLFRLPDNPSIVPKVGAGMALGFVRFDRLVSGDSETVTEVGVHLLGGVEFPLGGIQPFVEGGVNLTSELPQWVIRGGVGFALGGGG